MKLLNLSQGLKPIHSGHPDIEQDQRRTGRHQKANS